MDMQLPSITNETSNTTQTSHTSADVDALWMVTAAMIVFFMQGGFSLVEASMARRNFILLLLKNMMDIIIVSLCWWIIGFSLVFGAGTLVGPPNDSFFALDPSLICSVPFGKGIHWFFSFVFTGASVTIVSGAMADRTKFTAYAAFSVVGSFILFPLPQHWVWSSTGFLSAVNSEAILPVIDFAGSGVLHMVGGCVGLIGAKMVGPRKGIFTKKKRRIQPSRTVSRKLDRRSRAIQAITQESGNFEATIGMQTMGTLILWFAWFAFNAGSTQAFTTGAQDYVGQILVNTTLGGSSAAVTSLLICRYLSGTYMLDKTLNGVLAGLVSVTAGCPVIPNWGAVFLGSTGSMLYLIGSYAVKRACIDDPVDAFAVHGICGFWGLVGLGLVYDAELLGLLYDTQNSRAQVLGYQTGGALVLLAWSVVMAFAVFWFIQKLPGMEGVLADHHGSGVGSSVKELKRVTSMPWMEARRKYTIVFTDIEGSTELWEIVPRAMEEAVEMHHEALRKLLTKYGGYEVKTEGDAFMVVFDNPQDAMCWSLAVQESLLMQEWPRELLRCASSAVSAGPNGAILFRGLRVRIGVHNGECSCKRDPTSGRMDFYGTVVNRAARVASQAKGGQIATTIEVVDALRGKLVEESESEDRVRFVGTTKTAHAKDSEWVLEVPSHENVCICNGRAVLKGISEPVPIFMVYPQHLRWRHYMLGRKLQRSGSLDSGFSNDFDLGSETDGGTVAGDYEEFDDCTGGDAARVEKTKRNDNVGINGSSGDAVIDLTGVHDHGSLDRMMATLKSSQSSVSGSHTSLNGYLQNRSMGSFGDTASAVASGSCDPDGIEDASSIVPIPTRGMIPLYAEVQTSGNV